MPTRPAISIILPTYNRAALLPRAIQSVIDQTYPHWELIIWDDGSTDDTAGVVKAFNDNRIRYYHDTNHGAAYARNHALEQASAEIIAFLDSDDTWQPEKLAIQMAALQKYPQIELMFSDFLNCNLEKKLEREAFEENQNAIKLLQTRQLDEHIHLITSRLLDALAYENMIATDTVVIRRSVIQNYGVFNEELRNSEDFELWWRLGLAGVCMAYDTRLLLNRYKPAGSLSSASLLSHQNRIKALDACKEHALAAGKTAEAHRLRKQYRNTWHNLVTAYSVEKQPGKMLNAFIQSLKYGFRPGSVRLLIHGCLRLMAK